jgi:hypothetical protein
MTSSLVTVLDESNPLFPGLEVAKAFDAHIPALIARSVPVEFTSVSEGFVAV